MNEPRQNLNIELTATNKDRLEKLRNWNGMTQKEMVSRVLGWFCDQDRVVQQIILGQIPEDIAPDVATLMLKRMNEDTGQTRKTKKRGRSALVVEIPSDPIKR
ncbi:hypothetical protein KS4_00590 [Poriferisphaera corsica]|uniref:Uncharacterized protein n=1 Tax=Poriferisphaera corsica TaxID=2528020 RepID=A0A517YP87_9BACT|nr:hypothetical protein [Poriferisphaera corsica]QDU32031.1 hypothetical protein KS4_00590 [Poriferisphaera corsica]